MSKRDGRRTRDAARKCARGPSVALSRGETTTGSRKQVTPKQLTPEAELSVEGAPARSLIHIDPHQSTVATRMRSGNSPSMRTSRASPCSGAGNQRTRTPPTNSRRSARAQTRGLARLTLSRLFDRLARRNRPVAEEEADPFKDLYLWLSPRCARSPRHSRP